MGIMPEKKQSNCKKKTRIKSEAIGDNRQKDGRFGPGNCANPDGRPVGSFSLVEILKAELQKCPEGQDKRTYADLIVKRMLKDAIEKGDQQQIKLIWNYIEGMPKQAMDITTNGKSLNEIDEKQKEEVARRIVERGK